MSISQLRVIPRTEGCRSEIRERIVELVNIISLAVKCRRIPCLWSYKMFMCILAGMGPLFIKLGQILSVRPDICSPEIAALLSSLREQVPPQYINIRTLLTQPQIILLEDTPLACGSIAQVYRGLIKRDNKLITVVFKVIKPGVSKQIVNDLAIVKKIAHLIDYIRPMWRVKHCVTELSTFIIKQTDFVTEKDNMTLFKQRGFNVPTVIPSLSTNNVLCMEYIVSDTNITLREKYTAFVKLCGSMLSNPCLLHLDLHPGNILWVREDDIVKPYLIDLGLSQSVDEELHTLLINTILSIMRKDHATFAKLFLRKDMVAPPAWLNYIRSLFTDETITTRTVITIFVSILRHCHVHGICIDERMSSIVMALTIINGHYNELAESKDDFLRDVLFEM